VDMAVEGTPFRDAYRETARRLDELDAADAESSLAARVSPGACGALNLNVLEARLSKLTRVKD